MNLHARKVSSGIFCHKPESNWGTQWLVEVGPRTSEWPPEKRWSSESYRHARHLAFSRTDAQNRVARCCSLVCTLYPESVVHHTSKCLVQIVKVCPKWLSVSIIQAFNKQHQPQVYLYNGCLDTLQCWTLLADITDTWQHWGVPSGQRRRAEINGFVRFHCLGGKRRCIMDLMYHSSLPSCSVPANQVGKNVRSMIYCWEKYFKRALSTWWGICQGIILPAFRNSRLIDSYIFTDWALHSDA